MDCFSNCVLMFLLIVFIIFVINIPSIKQTFRGHVNEGNVRYIRIENLDKNHLSLAEVQVFDNDNNLISLNKPTSQSKTKHGGVSSRAVDGNTSGMWQVGSVTHTGSHDSWWEIDLQSSYKLSKIIIFNRSDCCQSRLRSAKIKLLNSERELIQEIDYGQEQPTKTFIIHQDSNNNSNNNNDNLVSFPTLGITKRGNEISVSKLGIGTDNPISNLDIKGSDKGAELSLYHGGEEKKFASLKYVNNSTRLLTSGNNPNLKIDIKDNDVIKTALFANKDGIGIGTDEPKSNLDVKGNSDLENIFSKSLCLYNENKDEETKKCLNLQELNSIDTRLDNLGNSIGQNRTEINNRVQVNTNLQTKVDTLETTLSNVNNTIIPELRNQITKLQNMMTQDTN